MSDTTQKNNKWSENEIGALWQQTSKKEEKYLKGYLELPGGDGILDEDEEKTKVKVLVFKCKPKDKDGNPRPENYPNFRVFLAPDDDEENAPAAAAAAEGENTV